MEQRDFFISYTKADRAEADWIAETLIRHGYSVYIQTRDIGPADSFVEKMEEFMDNSRSFIAVWSEQYSHSKFAMWEFRAAFTAQRHGQMEMFLPVCIENYPLPRLYAHIVHADLYGVKEDEKTHRLLGAVGYTEELKFSADKLYQLGQNYYYGIDVKQDFTQARHYYEQAAELGNASALYSLGYLYLYGLSVEVNYSQSRQYYEKGSEHAPQNLERLRYKMAKE